jgi:hypothetical protein
MSARWGTGMGRIADREMTEREQTSLLAPSAVYPIVCAGLEGLAILAHPSTRQNSSQNQLRRPGRP